jgi:RNA polymerase sigma-70 factor (ECF subfamily)
VVALAIGAGAGAGVVMTYDARTAHAPSVPQAPAVAAEPSNTSSSAQHDQVSERRISEPQVEAIVSAPPRATIRDRPAPPAAVLAPSLSDDRPSTPSLAGSPPLIAPVQPAPRLEPAGPATVTAEAELLRRADAALKAADPSRALALLGEHATTFPNGILVEERDAERVVVLCALGRTEDARAAAAQFLRLRPRSPLSQRVRESCGGI